MYLTFGVIGSALSDFKYDNCNIRFVQVCVQELYVCARFLVHKKIFLYAIFEEKKYNNGSKNLCACLRTTSKRLHKLLNI